MLKVSARITMSSNGGMVSIGLYIPSSLFLYGGVFLTAYPRRGFHCCYRLPRPARGSAQGSELISFLFYFQ